MSRNRQRRAARAWWRYQRRNDALVHDQRETYQRGHPMRVAPGFWRHAWGYSEHAIHQMRKMRKTQGGGF